MDNGAPVAIIVSTRRGHTLPARRNVNKLGRVCHVEDTSHRWSRSCCCRRRSPAFRRSAPTRISASSGKRPATLPHDEALKLLGETLGKSIEATQSDPSIPDILDALQTNIEATRRIRDMVDGADTVTEEQIAEVAQRDLDDRQILRRRSPVWRREVFERRYAELSRYRRHRPGDRLPHRRRQCAARHAPPGQ